MSDWHEVTDPEDVKLSEDGGEIEILFDTNEFGNCYVTVPVDVVAKLLDTRTKSKPFLNKLYQFTEQHEGRFPWVDGFSSGERVAMSAFSEWLDLQIAQQIPQQAPNTVTTWCECHPAVATSAGLICTYCHKPRR